MFYGSYRWSCAKCLYRHVGGWPCLTGRVPSVYLRIEDEQWLTPRVGGAPIYIDLETSSPPRRPKSCTVAARLSRTSPPWRLPGLPGLSEVHSLLPAPPIVGCGAGRLQALRAPVLAVPAQRRTARLASCEGPHRLRSSTTLVELLGPPTAGLGSRKVAVAASRRLSRAAPSPSACQARCAASGARG